MINRPALFEVAVPTTRDIWWGSVAATFVLEAVTCVLRFAVHWDSTRDTASTIGVLTLGIRIHHSYIGLAVMAVAWWYWQTQPKVSRWMLMLGAGLFASDMIHHFVVLWPLTGSPCFDLVYPS